MEKNNNNIYENIKIIKNNNSINYWTMEKVSSIVK